MTVRLAVLTCSAVASLVLVAVAVVLWRAAEDRTMALASAQTTAVAEAVRLGADTDQLLDSVARTDLGARGLLGVRGPDGWTVGTVHAAATPTAPASAPGETVVDAPGGTAVVRTVPTEGGLVTVEAFLPDGTVWSAVRSDYVLLGLVGVTAVALAALAAAIAVRPTLGKLAALQRAVASLGHGELGDIDSAVRITGPPELARIGAGLNRVSRRVRDLVTRERAMVADLSHRMRTPLTALRLDADSIGPGPLADRIREAVATLDADLADVIRSAEKQPDRVSAACDAVQVVRTRMRFWTALADHQGRPCRLDCEVAEAHVGVDAADVAAVVDALVTNVFQHTSPTTPLEVTVVKHAGWVNLVVEDGGVGIGDTSTALRRGVSGRGSTGLGLAIARETAASCGGSIRIDRGRLGGARIHLRLSELGVQHSPSDPRACRILPRYRERDRLTDH
ncbi:sensor histidine kinase [Labedaea rhizosphaerae]|nr:HAMP domain-containing sensor histidine kinase [Labedaea rhizosphaerae]